MKKLVFMMNFALIVSAIFANGKKEAGTSRQGNVQHYFEGSGGKGLTLAVLAPTGNGLTASEQYLLPLVQGSITGDFNKYSAITIIDRQNLEKILSEQAQSVSGNYTDEDYIRIGQLVNARYIFTGSITKTPSGSLIVEFSVSNAESGVREASYPPKTVSALALENLSAIKDVSYDILEQLGVHLTDIGRQTLLKTEDTRTINAETALSKAITAQKNGTLVEALSYYFQAVNYDSSLPEAASRLNILSANISSGNMGADVRNDIQWRRQWIERLIEAEQYYADYMKNFAPAYYLVFSTRLQQGNTDYENETVPINFTVELFPDAKLFDTPEKIINIIRNGLLATKRSAEWGLDWPAKTLSKNTPFVDNYTARFTVVAELNNDEGIVIGKQSIVLNGSWSVDAESSLRILPFLDRQNLFFPSVNANLITDKLVIRIVSVDGLSPEVAAENKHINIMSDIDYAKLPEVRSGKDSRNIIFYKYSQVMSASVNRSGTVKMGYLNSYKGKLRNIVIPPSISGITINRIFWDAFRGKNITGITIPDSVTSIEGPAFSSNKLTSVVIPNSVTSIGSEAFSNNNLTSVVIPNSVTSIGSEAFSNNNLTSVVIPNNVTSIKWSAFSNNNLTSVVIPNSVTSIGSSAFSNNNLTSVVIPNSVTSIGASAFSNNNLASVVIPNSVTSIESYAFSNNNLTSVVISDSVTSIGHGAFSNNNLTSVVIPDSVVYIDAGAFLHNNIVSITIGANVEMERFFRMFENEFSNFYNSNGKKAGTYVYSNRKWIRR
jgi:hypothetical protein